MSLAPLPIEIIYSRSDRYGWPTARNKQLYFCQDWTSAHFPIWRKYCFEFKDKENIGYLEIGSYQGFSACWFLDVILTHPSSYVTLIEPNIVLELNDNIKKIDYKGKINILNTLSENALKNIKEKFDIIYIDGDHTTPGTLRDANACWPLLKNNGIIIFDDYLWKENPDENKRPKNGVDMFLKNIEYKFELLHKDYQVIIKKKNIANSGVIDSNGNQPNRLLQENSFVCGFDFKQRYI